MLHEVHSDVYKHTSELNLKIKELAVYEIKDMLSLNYVKTLPMYMKGNMKRLSIILIIDAVLKVERLK